MYRTWLHLIFSVLITLALSHCASKKGSEEEAYSHFKIGVSLLAKNKKSEGLDHLLKAKELDPNNALFLNHLGLAYFLMGEYEHAVVALEQSIDADPKYSEAHNNLGRVYIEIKNFALARKHLKEAASDLTYSHKDKVWLNMGLSYFHQGEYKTSENHFLKSISMNRENCLAYNFYGRALIEQEKYEKAAKALDQAIYHCRDKGFDEPHYYSAIAFFRMGFKSKAIARLQEGRKRFPDGPNRQKIDEMINLMKITETR